MAVTREEYYAMEQRFIKMQQEAANEIATLKVAIEALSKHAPKNEFEIPMRDIIPEQYSGKVRNDFLEWAENSMLYMTKVDDGATPDLLEWVVLQTTEISKQIVDNFVVEKGWNGDKVHAFSRALYKYLYMKTSGSARRIVRNGAKHDGYNAWRRLFAEYDPKLVTGAQGHLKRALGMGRAKNVSEVSAKIQELEEHIRKYEECGKKFDEDFKVQKLYDVIPADAEKQLLLERKGREAPVYTELLARISNWCQMAHSGPTPMDTDALGKDDQTEPESEKDKSSSAASEKESEWPAGSWVGQPCNPELYGMWNKGGKAEGKGGKIGKGFQGDC